MTTSESAAASTTRVWSEVSFTGAPHRRRKPRAIRGYREFREPDRSRPAQMDGSAQDVAAPTTRRGAHRACGWLRQRSASRSDEICRAKPSAAKARPGTRRSGPTKCALSNPAGLLRRRAGRLRRRSPRRIPRRRAPKHAQNQSPQLHFERRKRRVRHRASRMNHDVPSRRILRSIAPQNFADAAPYAVAYHRAPQRFLHADAEAAARETVRAIKNCKLRTGAPLAAAIHGLVIRAAQQARVPGKPESAA